VEHGSSGIVPTQKVLSPEFKPQYCKKRRRRRKPKQQIKEKATKRQKIEAM
jgi:hypothetical protein